MRLWYSILLAFALVPPFSGPSPADELDRDAPFRAVPVALVPAAPGQRRAGALDFVRGYRLESGDRAFGGFSAMASDGRRFTLLTDGGEGAAFDLGADGRITRPRIFTLPAFPRIGFEKKDRDSESLAHDPASGRFWVGFENANQIWRYAPGFARAERRAAPPAMAEWPENRGAEAMVRLADGRFVVIGEDAIEGAAGEPRPLLIFARDPAEAPAALARARYQPPDGYSPTDMTELPDGRLIIVNRRARLDTGFTACLTLIDRAALRPGATIRGRVIARFAPPMQHDNFEGIVALRQRDGIHLWLVADDNQLWLEQSLLLEFRLDERRAAAIAAAKPAR